MYHLFLSKSYFIFVVFNQRSEQVAYYRCPLDQERIALRIHHILVQIELQ